MTMGAKAKGSAGATATPVSDKIDLASQQWSVERPDVDVVLFQFVTATAMIGQQIEIEFRAMAQQFDDMAEGDLRILLLLRRSAPTYAQRPVDLVRNLLVTSGAITKQIARLEARGLVCRVPQRDGSRRSLIKLTSAGREIADRAGIDSFPLLREAFNGFSAEEQGQGVRFARRLLGKLERARLAAGSDDTV